MLVGLDANAITSGQDPLCLRGYWVTSKTGAGKPQVMFTHMRRLVLRQNFHSFPRLWNR